MGEVVKKTCKYIKTRLEYISPKEWAIFLTAVFVLSIMPLLILGKYVYPCADDYTFGSRCYFVWKDTHSVFMTVLQACRGSIDLFFEWAGCFSSSFFMILQPAVFGDKYYHLTPLIMIGIVSVGTTFFFHALLGKGLQGNHWQVQSIVMLLLFAIIQGAPGPNQAYFWYNGATHYTLMYGFWMLLMGTVILFLLTTEKKKKIAYLVVSSILGIIVGAGNYLTALNGALLYAFLLLVLVVVKKFKEKILILIPVFFYFLSFILSVTAPGNKVREAGSAGMNPLKAILVSFYYLFNYCFGQWMGWMQIVTLCFVGIIFGKMSKKMKFDFSYPLLVIGLLMGLAAAMMTPCLFGMGNIEGERITTVVYTVFMVYLTLGVCYVTGWISQRTTQIKTEGFVYNLALITCLLILVVGYVITVIPEPQTFTTSEAVRELVTGEAKQYGETLEKRTKVYHSGEKNLIVDKLPVQPPLLYTTDIQSDPQDWENLGVCRFFGLESVQTKK